MVEEAFSKENPCSLADLLSLRTTKETIKSIDPLVEGREKQVVGSDPHRIPETLREFRRAFDDVVLDSVAQASRLG